MSLSSSVHTAVVHDERVEVHHFTRGHRLSSGGKDLIDDLRASEMQHASAIFSSLVSSEAS